MSKNTSFQDDVPWRVSSSSLKPLPKIHHSPILRVSHTPLSDYAISIMRHPDPIGNGLGDGAIVEAAGPECLVPGQSAPIKLLGLKVWPIEVDLKFLEPVGRELKALGKDAEGISDAEVVLMSEEVVSHALETIIEEEHVAPKVEKVNDTDTSSHYGLDSGFYMSSFTATIFVVSLVTLGVLLITLLVSLVIMLQSCQSKSTGVIELVNMNNYYSYCRVYSLHAEINRLERYDLPNICRDLTIHYIKGGHYAKELNLIVSMIDDYFKNLRPSDNGLDVVLLDIDDIVPPNSYQRFHRDGISNCVKEAKHVKLMFVLRLYMNLQTDGWPIILVSREPETYQNVTINHLVSAGFRGWSSLMMRYSDYLPFISLIALDLLTNLDLALPKA
ncbi:hypothetical protein RYX36_011436 [Vicia faba]